MRSVWVLSNLVVAAAAATFAYGAAELVFGPSPQTTPALGIPLTLTYVIPMAGLALAALRSLANAVLMPGPPSSELPPTAAENSEEPNR